MQARAILSQEEVFEALANDDGGDPLLRSGTLVGLFVNWLEHPAKSDFTTMGPNCVDTLFASFGLPVEAKANH